MSEFPFNMFGGGDPEELQRAMAQFMEQAQQGQRVAFADQAINLAVGITVAAIGRLDLTGGADEQATQVRDGDHDTVVLALGIDCSARWMIDPKVCGAGQKEPQVLATSTTFGRSLGKSPTLATDIGQLPISGLAQIPQLDSVNNGRVIVLPLSAAKVQFARDDRVDTVYVTLADHADAATVQARIGKALDVLGPGYRVLTRNDPAARR